MPQNILDDQDSINSLKEALEKFILENNLAPKHENIKELVDLTVEHLKDVCAKNGEELTVKHLADPKFIKDLTLTISTLATLQSTPELKNNFNKILSVLTSNPELMKLKDNKEFMKEFDKILKMNPKTQQQDKELEKLLQKYPVLKPSEMKAVTEEMKLFNKELEAETNKNLEAQPNDPLIHTNSSLTGLISAAFTGGIAIVVSQFPANPFGVADVNPNDGMAAIDAQNSLKDTQFGDSAGLNQNTAENYSSIAGAAINAFPDVLKEFGLSDNDNKYQSPSPFNTRPTPR